MVGFLRLAGGRWIGCGCCPSPRLVHLIAQPIIRVTPQHDPHNTCATPVYHPYEREWVIVWVSTYSKVYEKDLIRNGFKIVIYANQLLRAAYPSMNFVAKKILENSRAYEVEKKIIPIKEIINLIKND